MLVDRLNGNARAAANIDQVRVTAQQHMACFYGKGN